MTEPILPSPSACADGRDAGDAYAVYARALDARDPRFDGVFFVGITTTRIYCRPICPARVSYRDHRRFFRSAAAAERSGFRPCLRCRPELAPGCSAVEAVPRLAEAAARRIAAGALNGRSVADLARDLGVSERHLRRAMEREVGASPLELAQTHRLLLAKRLLVDTALPVTQVAYASGFQSLRRFNAAFRERYRMPPSAVRRAPDVTVDVEHPTDGSDEPSSEPTADAPLRLTLAYRPPLAWDALLATLRTDALDGVELVTSDRWVRAVEIDGRRGVVSVTSADEASPRRTWRRTVATGARPRGAQLTLEISPSLAPALMPLLARLRHLFDLDAEPAVIDTSLAAGGLGALVARHPGLRLPGSMDGFETVLRALLGRRAADVVRALGEPLGTTLPGVDRLPPDAARVAEAGAACLTSLGIPRARADALHAIARQVADGSLRLAPGSSVPAAQRALAAVPGIGQRTAATVIARALDWPDAFTASDRVLQRAAGVATASALLVRAERWRPWRAYAALHLRMLDAHAPAALPSAPLAS